MSWRLLDDDPDKTEYFQYDDTTGDSIVKTEWKNTHEILDRNKSIQGRDVGRGTDNDMHHVASIPPSIIIKWMEEGINLFDKNHGPAVMKKLDDPEYRHLRVNTQQLGKRTRHI
jgi:hypothetical protein